MSQSKKNVAKSLTRSVAENILANSAGPIAGHAVIRRAKEKGILADDVDQDRAERELKRLASEPDANITLQVEGDLVLFRYAHPETDLVTKERDLDRPLIDWLATHGIQATAIQAPGNVRGRKKGEDKYRFPDVVAYRNLMGLSAALKNLANRTGAGDLELYSYEVKQKLTMADFRETILECVGNSSWAHRKYIVTHNLEADLFNNKREDFERHQVGLIHLEVGRAVEGLTYSPRTRELYTPPRGQLDLHAMHEYFETMKWRAFREWVDQIV
ncbi:MAG: hypothetical protein RIF32_12875 [Leptospirales bacterium]|jgi:hypothetical protein